MSNEKLSPEIMEEIQQYIKDRYPINEVTPKADQSTLEMFRSIFKEGAERGATIALTKQWVKVEEELKDLRIQFEYMQDNDCKSLAERIFFDGILAIIDTRIAALPVAPNNNQK